MGEKVMGGGVLMKGMSRCVARWKALMAPMAKSVAWIRSEGCCCDGVEKVRVLWSRLWEMWTSSGYMMWLRRWAMVKREPWLNWASREGSWIHVWATKVGSRLWRVAMALVAGVATGVATVTGD